MRPLRAFLVVMACGLGMGCSSTTVSTVWTAPERPAQPFQKVLAIVLNAGPAERRAGEDELAAAIRSGRGVPAYTILSDEEIKDRETIRAAAVREGFDASAVVKLVSTDRKTRYVPPAYTPSHDPFRSVPSATEREVIPGRTTTDTYVTAETSLYSVKDDALVWAGSSTTVNPSGIRDLVAQVCRGAIEELKKEGLVE